MERPRAQTTAEAFSELDKAVTELKSAMTNTAAWRWLDRFVDRRPLFARFAFPLLALGLSAYSLATNHPIEAIFYAIVALASLWLFRR